jgi:hypothetical protein
MSVLDRFYALPAARASQLASVAAPTITKRVLGLFKPKAKRRQAWIDFLEAHASESATVAGGVQLVRDLEHYLGDQGLPKLKDLAEPRLTAACASAVTQSSVIVFDHAHATAAADRLQALRPPAEADVTRWEFYGRAAEETDFACFAQRIEQGRQNLIARLKTVGPDQIGVLDVPDPS